MRLLGVLAISLASACLYGAGQGAGQTPSHHPFPFGSDLEGHPLARLAGPKTKAVVLLFVATDCPISNRYLPEWELLAHSLRQERVQFYTVYPNPGETAHTVQAQRAAFGASVKALLDEEQSLVRLAGARITPEAAVFMPEKGKLRAVYRGRIDDRYLDLGHQRPQATHKDLELAVKAVLAGTPVLPPGGRAVGCSIVPLSASQPIAQPASLR